MEWYWSLVWLVLRPADFGLSVCWNHRIRPNERQRKRNESKLSFGGTIPFDKRKSKQKRDNHLPHTAKAFLSNFSGSVSRRLIAEKFEKKKCFCCSHCTSHCQAFIFASIVRMTETVNSANCYRNDTIKIYALYRQPISKRKEDFRPVQLIALSIMRSMLMEGPVSPFNTFIYLPSWCTKGVRNDSF